MTTDLEAMKHILATLEANPSTNTREDMILQLLRHLIWHLEQVNDSLKGISGHQHIENMRF